MAVCGKCRRQIAPVDAKRAVTEKDENGKIKRILHFKCAHILKRQRQLDGAGRNTAPTAYEESGRKLNADDLTAEARERREKAEEELRKLRDLAAYAAAGHAIDAEAHALRTDADGKVNLDELLRDAEQQVALTTRQEELAAERAKEEAPSGEADWRDPIETEI